MTEKLNPCVFCGGKADFVSRDNYSAHTFWKVVCQKCGCETYSDKYGYGYEDEPGKEKAAQEWNEKEGGLNPLQPS